MQSYERPGIAELRERLAVVESQIGTVTTDVNAVAEKVGELLDLVETVRRHSPSSATAEQGTAAADDGEGADTEKNGRDGEGDDNPYVPFSFYASDDDAERARKRTRLIDWVDTVLVPMYRVSPAELPGCWPRHPFVVEQLEALRAEWTRIYYPDPDVVPPAGRDALDWHQRYWPQVYKLLGRATRGSKEAPPEFDKCILGQAHEEKDVRLTVTDRQTHRGVAPG